MIRGEPQDHPVAPHPYAISPQGLPAAPGSQTPAGEDRIGRFLKEVASTPQRAAQVQCLRIIPSRPARHGGEDFSGTTALEPLPPTPGGGAGGPGPADEEALALHPRWRAYLAGQGISRLWIHQARAIRLALSGKNVVVVTSTASGKTLCYNVPVLERFLRGADAAGGTSKPGSGAGAGDYALYLYPTKALAQDQLRVLEGMVRGLELNVEIGVFDGDTEPDARRRLRRCGRIILTNPDMLHQTLLPHHGGWSGLFRGLKFVVVDEIHSLRGIFGSNVANVIRRLKRIAAHYGARPQFIAASATISNPAEHARRLLGEPVEVVDEDGSPQGERTFVLWNPPLVERPDGGVYRRGAVSTAVDLLPELLSRDVRTICFAQARNTVELILRYAWDRLRAGRSTAPLAGKLEAYRAGYLPQERREIEKRLFTGDLLGVVSTNALELGIDVGGLDACLLVGYPGTIASFHQRSGRAGRRGRRSLVLFIARPDPIDQYFMRHPETIFERSPESAIVEPDNPYLLTKHLLCAAYELPLGPRDGELFGGEDYFAGVVRLLTQGDRLREAEGRWFLVDPDYPAAKVKLRTVGDENFTIYEKGSAKIIGELDYVAGLLSLYEGAIYLHRSETHFVEELDVENRIARLRRDESGYYTQALCQKRVQVDAEMEARELAAPACGDLRLSEITVETRLTGFKKVRFHTSENVGYGEIVLPPLILSTVGAHLDVPSPVVDRAMRFGADFFQSGLQGAGRLISSLVPFFVMGDPQDIDYYIDGRRIYLYDLYPGGIGYAEKAFEIFERTLAAAREHVAACACPAGCPGCVLPSSTRYAVFSPPGAVPSPLAPPEGTVEGTVAFSPPGAVPSPPGPPEGAVAPSPSGSPEGEPSFVEYPYPKEAARYLLHLLCGAGEYVPRLDAVTAPAPPRPLAGREPLDPRVARRVRRAMGDMPGQAGS